MNNQERIAEIKKRLYQDLDPTHLEIIDNSAQHHGHAGAASGAGHFSLIISAPTAFQGKSKIQCHQLIYRAIGDMMHNEIHALSITLK